MTTPAQNLANEGLSSTILRTKDLGSKGGAGVFPVLGIARYFLWLITVSSLTSVGWIGLWKAIAMRLRGKGIKIFRGGLTDKFGGGESRSCGGRGVPQGLKPEFVSCFIGTA